MTMRALATLFVVLSMLSATQADAAGNPQIIPAFGPGRLHFIEVMPGEQIVLDRSTGLQWKHCVEGRYGMICGLGEAEEMNWQQALQAAAASTHAGYDDWRLPNINELNSLLELACWSPAISASFNNTPAVWHWSSTTEALHPSSAWAVDFNTGDSQANQKLFLGVVRLVRGGDGLEGFDATGNPQPLDFDFATQLDVPPATLVLSGPVQPQGQDQAAGVVVGGAPGAVYRINGGPFSASPGTLHPGDSIELAHLSAELPGGAAESWLEIAGIRAHFLTVTGDGDKIFADRFVSH